MQREFMNGADDDIDNYIKCVLLLCYFPKIPHTKWKPTFAHPKNIRTSLKNVSVETKIRLLIPYKQKLLILIQIILTDIK